MQNGLRCTFLLLAFAVSCSIHEASAENIPGEGDVFPLFKMAVPPASEHRSYLGLVGKSGDAFSLRDIRADLVIIEIFSMYCPYCQREAPRVNELYRRIQQDALGEKIKIIGIGAGNSSFEVGIFRKKYDVPFPLIPDDRFAIHKCLGEVRTPYFFAVKMKGEQPGVIVYSKLGGIDQVDDFLKSVIRLAGFAGKR